jgi:hypothetical protein
MHYYQITNPGTKDWITHEDNQIAHIAQYGNHIVCSPKLVGIILESLYLPFFVNSYR